MDTRSPASLLTAPKNILHAPIPQKTVYFFIIIYIIIYIKDLALIPGEKNPFICKI